MASSTYIYPGLRSIEFLCTKNSLIEQDPYITASYAASTNLRTNDLKVEIINMINMLPDDDFTDPRKIKVWFDMYEEDSIKLDRQVNTIKNRKKIISKSYMTMVICEKHCEYTKTVQNGMKKITERIVDQRRDPDNDDEEHLLESFKTISQHHIIYRIAMCPWMRQCGTYVDQLLANKIIGKIDGRLQDITHIVKFLLAIYNYYASYDIICNRIADEMNRIRLESKDIESDLINLFLDSTKIIRSMTTKQVVDRYRDLVMRGKQAKITLMEALRICNNRYIIAGQRDYHGFESVLSNDLTNNYEAKYNMSIIAYNTVRSPMLGRCWMPIRFRQDDTAVQSNIEFRVSNREDIILRNVLCYIIDKELYIPIGIKDNMCELQMKLAIIKYNPSENNIIGHMQGIVETGDHRNTISDHATTINEVRIGWNQEMNRPKIKSFNKIIEWGNHEGVIVKDILY